MNTDLNTEEYPRLTPPNVVYEHKDALKKKAVAIPLYVKMVAAAAAVALLFGIFWHRSVMPEQELMAELKPVEARQIVSNETLPLAESQAHFVVPKQTVKPTSVEPQNKRFELPLLTELKPIAAPRLMVVEPQPESLLVDDVYYAFNDMSLSGQEEDEYDDRSLIGRGIYQMTNGECDNFAALFSGGIKSFKTELASIETTIQSSRSQLRQRVR